jgi:sugar-specific transcriptional regulator TrmB
MKGFRTIQNNKLKRGCFFVKILLVVETTNNGICMDHDTVGIQPLMNLGLTELESRVYAYLLSENPATGYRIAKAVGKPAANTYEAIRSLESKGALVVNEDKKRLCSPVPLRQFLAQTKRQFESHLLLAESRFLNLESISGDQRIYQIRNVDQVMERCRSIFETAEKIVLVDAFPRILTRLKTHLEKAIQRGVEVFVKTYEPMKISGAKTVCDPRRPSLLSVYSGDWLRAVADGHRCIHAYFTDNVEVSQAIWSASGFVSLMGHFDLWTEFYMAKVARAIENGASERTIKRILSEHRRSRREHLTGYQTLKSAYPIEKIK